MKSCCKLCRVSAICLLSSSGNRYKDICHTIDQAEMAGPPRRQRERLIKCFEDGKLIEDDVDRAMSFSEYFAMRQSTSNRRLDGRRRR